MGKATIQAELAKIILELEHAAEQPVSEVLWDVVNMIQEADPDAARLILDGVPRLLALLELDIGG